MQIYVPQLLFRKYIEPKDEINVKAGVMGEYEVIKKHKSGVILQHLKFKNIFLDQGLCHLALNGYYTSTNVYELGSACLLGAGTTTPTSTDTQLESGGGYSAAVNYAEMDIYGTLLTDYENYPAAARMRWRYDFGLSKAVGTWTEIGISPLTVSLSAFYSTHNQNIISRMLFKDDDGNPISVIKTDEETLTIYYSLYFVRTTDTPTTNVIDVEGTSVTVSSILTDFGLKLMAAHGGTGYYTFKLGSMDPRMARIGTGSGDLLPSLTDLYSPISTAPTIYNRATSPGSYPYREFVFEWSNTVVGTISEAYWTPGDSATDRSPMFMMQFDPPIEKTDTDRKIRLRTRVTFARISE